MRRIIGYGGIAAVLTAVFGLMSMVSVHAATPVGAKSADAFVDSIGVNTHLDYGGTWDGRNWPAIKQRLIDAGIRNIRDGYGNTHQDVSAFVQDLNRTGGVKIDFYADDRYNTSLDQYEQMWLGELKGAVASIEGPNEVDNRGPGWESRYRGYAQQLSQTVRGNPGTSHIPLLSPSFACGVCTPRLQSFGDVSAWTDYGNTHNYTGGQMLTDALMDEMFRNQAVMTGKQPVMSTETGFSTNVKGANADHPPVAAPQAGILGLRIYFEHFARGVPRTFWYDLADESTDTSQWGNGWGMLQADAGLSPKPLYTAIKDTTSLLKDPGPSFTPGSLAYTLQGANANTRSLLLQKRNGTFWLVVWQQAEVWARGNLVPLSPADLPLTLQLDAPASSLAVYHPGQGTQAQTSVGNTATLPLRSSANLQLIEIGSGPLRSAAGQQVQPSSPGPAPAVRPVPPSSQATPRAVASPNVAARSTTSGTPACCTQGQRQGTYPSASQAFMRWLQEYWWRFRGRLRGNLWWR